MLDAFLPLAFGAGISALGNYLCGQASADAASQAAQLQQQRFNEAKGYQTPFIQGGQNALATYNTAVGANGTAAQQSYIDSFRDDPGYRASVTFGQDQLTARAAAQGQTLSGNTLAGLQDYSQKNMLGAYQTRLDNLFRASQLGAASANSLTSAATTSAANEGHFDSLAGQYAGNALVNASKSIGSGAKDISTYYYGSKLSDAS